MSLSLKASADGLSLELLLGATLIAKFDVGGIADGVLIASNAEAQAGVNLKKLLTPANLNATVLGIGQTWQDVKASRAANTTYTNTTGRPIQVAIQYTVTNGASTALVNGLTIGRIGITTSTIDGSISFIVPNGSTYSFSATASNWLELR